MCSLKVLELEGSPSRTLLRLMAERGCTAGHLIDHLQTLGNAEALECLKPSGGENRTKWSPPPQCLAVELELESNSLVVHTVSPSNADHRSAPACGSPVWTQPAPQLLRCGQVARALPVVQEQRGGEPVSMLGSSTLSHVWVFLSRDLLTFLPLLANSFISDFLSHISYYISQSRATYFDCDVLN